MTTASDAGNGWRTDDTYYYRASGDQMLSEAVVRAVAACSDRRSAGVDADEPLDPLYETIDPDALDALFRDAADDPRTGAVEFAYAGHVVTVRSTGLVAVADRT